MLCSRWGQMKQPLWGQIKLPNAVDLGVSLGV
jgi:hypothetical protein